MKNKEKIVTIGILVVMSLLNILILVGHPFEIDEWGINELPDDSEYTEDIIIYDITFVGEPIMEWNSDSKEYTLTLAFETKPGIHYDNILANFTFYKGRAIGSKMVYIEADGSKNKIIAKLPEEPNTFGYKIVSADIVS